MAINSRNVNGPFFVGVGGGSASGKTTLVLELKRALAPLAVQVVHQDHYYKRGNGIPRYYSPSLKGWFGDYNHGRSFRWKDLVRFCRRAKGGNVLILEGLLALYRPELRGMMGLRLFVSCPARERLRRRLLRGVGGWNDARHRRYWAECVEPGFRRFVEPTRRHAEIVIRNRRGKAAGRRKAVKRLCDEIRRRMQSRNKGAGKRCS